MLGLIFQHSVIASAVEELGRVKRVDAEARALMVRYEDRRVRYKKTQLDEIMPAYAVSVHKSQGSEFPAVVEPVLTRHYLLLQRNLLYTAVTRGKRLVVLIGTKKAPTIAVKNTDTRKRRAADSPLSPDPTEAPSDAPRSLETLSNHTEAATRCK